MWLVINLIPLIGWNYNIQTGENISTSESTRIITGHTWFLTWLMIKSYSWKPPWFSKSQKWKVILQKTQNDLSKPTTYTTNNHHIHYHSRMYIHTQCAARAYKKEQWKITWLLYGNWLWSKLSSLLLFWGGRGTRYNIIAALD